MSTQPNPLDTSQYVLTYVNATKYYNDRANHLIEEDFKVKVSNWKMGYRPGLPLPTIPNITILDERKLNEYFSRLSRGDIDHRISPYEYAATLAPLPVDPKELEPPFKNEAPSTPAPNNPVGDVSGFDDKGDDSVREVADGVELRFLHTGMKWDAYGATWEWRRNKRNPYNKLDGRWHRIG